MNAAAQEDGAPRTAGLSPRGVHGRSLTVAALIALFGMTELAVAAVGPELAWVEDFASDPVAAGRFVIRPAGAADRFTYDAGEFLLTAHYDTQDPQKSTAWYARPIDPTPPSADKRQLGRYDDFEFSVTFRISSEGFSTAGYGQIAWGLVNSVTTGEDRAGCSNFGPYAYDCVTFDYFPNESYPTFSPTIIHSDDGQGFWSNIDFAMGPETLINTAAGDENISTDAVYTARVVYDGLEQVATLTIKEGDRLLTIGADGGGGLVGGSDGDSTTIQTQVFIDNGFDLDSFALTAWEDTCPPVIPVTADLDIFRIEFHAPAVVPGDMNRDGLVDGEDIGPFVQALTGAQPAGGLVYRGDFTDDGALNLDDVPGFVAALVQQ